MSGNRQKRRQLLVAIVAVATMMFTVVPAAPASAGQTVGALQGTLRNSGGLGTCGTGTLTATITGIHGTAPNVLLPVSASLSYCGGLVTAEGTGTINIGSHACNLAWSRVGMALVVTIRDCDTAGTAIWLLVPIAGTNDYVVGGAGVLPLHS